MALSYLLSPEFQISVTSGRPDTGGWIETFLAGSRTKYITACDFNGTKNPFRIPLDSLGQAVVLAEDDRLYDVFVYNRYGTLLFSRYNVATAGGGGGEPVTNKRCVHRLLRYFTNSNEADAEHPVGDWLHDLDNVDPDDPSGHPMVTADQLFDWYEAGQNFELYEVDGTNGQLGWSAIYRMVTWQDQSEWWSQYAETPGKACRLEFFRMGMYSTPYRGGLIAYIRYKDEDYMRLYEIKSGNSIWMAEYQEKLPYYSSNWHNGDYLKVKNDGSGLEWSAVNVPTATSQLTNDSGFITSDDLPAVNDGTLTIKLDGTTVQTFSANESADKTANIVLPQVYAIQNTREPYYPSSTSWPVIGYLSDDGATTVCVVKFPSDVTTKNISVANNGTITFQKKGVYHIHMEIPVEVTHAAEDTDANTNFVRATAAVYKTGSSDTKGWTEVRGNINRRLPDLNTYWIKLDLDAIVEDLDAVFSCNIYLNGLNLPTNTGMEISVHKPIGSITRVC